MLAVVVAVARSRDGSTAADVDQTRPGTVLLVAGYGGSTSALDGLGQALRASGRAVTIVPPVGDNTGDLREQAKALDRSARRAIEAGAPSVDVVGYSAGGVVVRIWAADLGGADLTRRVVTLGSPHHGTDVAGLASRLLGGSCPTACRQLAPGSDVLRSLPETPSGPRWTSIWTANDDLVTPPTSASLAGAVDVELQQVCADARVEHGGLPTDPLTTGLVKRALTGAGLSARPPASDCAALRQAGT